MNTLYKGDNDDDDDNNNNNNPYLQFQLPLAVKAEFSMPYIFVNLATYIDV